MVKLLPHTLTHAFEKSRTTSKDDVLEEVLLDIVVALLHRAVGVVLHTVEVSVLGTRLLGLEEDLSSLKALGTIRILRPSGSS